MKNAHDDAKHPNTGTTHQRQPMQHGMQQKNERSATNVPASDHHESKSRGKRSDTGMSHKRNNK